MQFINQLQRITLYIFCFSINFEMWDPFNSGDVFSIAKFTALIYFITIIPQIPQFLRIDNLKTVLFPLWIFFGFLTFMSIININELFSDFIFAPFLLNIIIFWILINHERKDYLIIEKGLLWFVLGTVVLVLLFFAGIGVEYEEGRLSMFGDNQNTLGIKVTVSSIILIVSVIQNRLNLGWYRYLFLIIIPFMLIFIAETGSRQSVIAFVLAFLMGAVLYKAKTNLSKISILVGSLICLIFIGILLMQSEIMIQRLENTSNSGDLGSRDLIWKTIFPIIKENPIVGIGKTGYDFQSFVIFGRFQKPHNVFLEILCYTGIIGLFIYLTFTFQVMKISYLTYKKNGMLLSLLFISPILGMFISGHILGTKICWLIFAYMVSSSAIKYGDNKIGHRFI